MCLVVTPWLNWGAPAPSAGASQSLKRVAAWTDCDLERVEQLSIYLGEVAAQEWGRERRLHPDWSRGRRIMYVTFRGTDAITTHQGIADCRVSTGLRQLGLLVRVAGSRSNGRKLPFRSTFLSSKSGIIDSDNRQARVRALTPVASCSTPAVCDPRSGAD